MVLFINHEGHEWHEEKAKAIVCVFRSLMALSEVGCISEASYSASFAGGILYRRAAA
jgi:hypothetical protein